MTKFLILGLVLIFSSSLFAQDCASNIGELKVLVGNSDLPLTWLENGKNPLLLKIKNGPGRLSLGLTKLGEHWADVTGVVCRKGSNFVAKVHTMEWGSAAPGIAKSTNIKEITLKLPYQSLLKVKVSILTFEFSPHH